MPTQSDQQPVPGAFLSFALTCARIGADARKLEKIRVLGEYLRGLEADALGLASTWFTGRPFPASQNKVLKLGWAVLRQALCAVGGADEDSFHQTYLKHSDLGETAAEILQHRTVEPSLSIERVGEVLNQLETARGPLSKTPILRAALAQCTALEVKYLVKIITGDLRIGLKEGLVEEAIASAFSRPPEEVRRANLLTGDIGETAKLAAENRLCQTGLMPFRAVKCMLASPEETAAGVWKRLLQNRGKAPAASSAPATGPIELQTDQAVRAPFLSVLKTGDSANLCPPETMSPSRSQGVEVLQVWLEDKYDGIRCQMHKIGRRVALYSRDSKGITSTFLELTDIVSRMATDFILDGEIVAMRGEKVLAFAELQKRLGRRERDLFMNEEVPISYVAFDCLWLGGTSLLDRSLRERRSALESLSPLPAGVRFAHITQARSVTEIEEAFVEARFRGNEGLVIKDPASAYTPGRRGLAWLKLKKPLATLDCVVIGAEYGHGKRRRLLSDYTFAIRDEQSGELKTIGKAYTGLTDAEIGGLTEHFLKTAIHRHGRYFDVPPDTVLEIAFDRLQRSNRHSSGLAMRFPRILRIRTDKTPADIDTLETARRLTDGSEVASF